MKFSTVAIVVSSALVGAAVLTGPAEATGPARPPRAQQERLVRDWVQVWNGDYAPAKRIIAPTFGVHAALLDGGDGSAIKGPDGLVAMVSQIRAPFPDLRFDVQVGPIIDGPHVVVRWIATGTYQGGFPGATAPVGTRITFTGVDILRTEHGKFVEYWLNADTTLLLTQLKVTAA